MAELSGALLTFMDDLDAVCVRLENNPLVLTAKTSIEEKLNRAKISVEEREKLFSAYVQQISLGLLGQGVEIVRDVPTAKYNEDKARFDRASAEASLRKQFGFEIDAAGKLVDKNDGLLDKQIHGFGKDMFYKISSIIGQENQMLVQNDQSVKEWQVDAWKLAVEAMSDGKISFKETSDASGDPVTTVEWIGDAEEPNGLTQ